MTVRSIVARLTSHEGLNFFLTNRVPRQALTRLMGRFSRIEQPLVRDLSIAIWRLFCDVDLSDAKESSFRSMRDCFTRELKDGARPIDRDPRVLVSPCDAIVGASGVVVENVLLQVKGAPYTLEELLCDPDVAALFRNGRYVTLRLTAGMYHRFHAPYDCRVREVTHIAGDAWNVNPSALKRVEKVYCRNERAVLRLDLGHGQNMVLVAVAAILVADVRLRFLDIPVARRDRDWTAHLADICLLKGEEMGWFEQGSTIVALVPGGFSLCDGIQPGHRILVGEPLLLHPEN